VEGSGGADRGAGSASVVGGGGAANGAGEGGGAGGGKASAGDGGGAGADVGSGGACGGCSAACTLGINTNMQSDADTNVPDEDKMRADSVPADLTSTAHC
jgi:hypothetical protein